MTILGEIFILIGSLFIFFSAIGLLRMPDFLSKLQVGSKAAAFGIFSILIGTNMILLDWKFALSSIAIFLFLLITTPIAAHALAQAEKRLR